MASTIAEAAEKAFTEFEARQGGTPAPEVGTELVDEEPEVTEAVEAEDVEDDDPYGELGGDEPDEAPVDSSDAETPPNLDNRIEVTEDATIVLPDGTEIQVKDSALRQADYTRKTQQVAEERKAAEALKAEADQVLQNFEVWYQDRAANPDKWIVEIAGNLPDRGVRTQMIARALRDLASSGYLEDDFVEMFGLKSGQAAEYAQTADEADRIAKLEAQLSEQQQSREIEARVRQRAAVLQSQWDEIKLSYGLEYQSTQEEYEAKKETLTFARENGVANLRVAFDAMQARRQTATPRQPDAATTQKKRASRAISQKSKAAGQIAPPTQKAKTIRQAAELALDKYLGSA
jgi:hypothetical protein